MEPARGSTPYFNGSLSNTAVQVTAYPTRIFWCHFINPNTTDIFIQVFDKLAADVTVGVTVPNQSWIVPGGTGASNRGAFEEQFSFPIQMITALSIAATTTPTGAGAPASASISNLGFK